jgi:hypothetical protein
MTNFAPLLRRYATWTPRVHFEGYSGVELRPRNYLMF